MSQMTRRGWLAGMVGAGAALGAQRTEAAAAQAAKARPPGRPAAKPKDTLLLERLPAEEHAGRLGDVRAEGALSGHRRPHASDVPQEERGRRPAGRGHGTSSSRGRGARHHGPPEPEDDRGPHRRRGQQASRRASVRCSSRTPIALPSSPSRPTTVLPTPATRSGKPTNCRARRPLAREA